MLISGKIASALSEPFGIAENLFYRWKRMATMKTSNVKSLLSLWDMMERYVFPQV
jgi:hypothetical protein